MTVPRSAREAKQRSAPRSTCFTTEHAVRGRRDAVSHPCPRGKSRRQEGERRGLIPLCELLHINGTYLLSTGVDYRSLRGTCWTLPSLAAALADTPDELEPLVRMKVRFRASRSPTRTARTVAIGAHGVARR